VWHSNKPRFAQLRVPVEFQQPNSGTYSDDFDLAAKCVRWELKKFLYQEKVRSLVIFCTDLNNYLPRS